MKLPEWIKKIYIICSAKSYEKGCKKCPFFKLPEDRFFCAGSLELLQERIESEIKFREHDEA